MIERKTNKVTSSRSSIYEMKGVRKRSKRVATGNELHGHSHENIVAVAAADDDDVKKGNVKEVAGDEVEVLYVSDGQQKMSDIKSKGKQVEEEALHGSDDDEYMMVDAERFFWKETQGKFTPLDEKYREEPEDDFFESLEMFESLDEADKEGERNGKGDGIGIEQDKPDTNKTNVEKGKEAVIVDETGEGKESVIREEEAEREMIASRPKEKGKGVLEMAASEEEGEEMETSEQQDQQKGESDNVSTVKKKRLLWTQELHYKFILAVEALGDDKFCAKAVHRKMNDPNVSREQIASHLQTYRGKLRRNSETSAGNKAPSGNPYNAKYPYLPRLEVKNVLKKSRDVMSQLRREISRRQTYGISGTLSFRAPNFSTVNSRQNNCQAPLTSPEATQMLNSSSAKFPISHVSNAFNLATTSSNVNQSSVGNASLNTNSGYVPKAENFPADSTDGSQDSDAMGISDPASANVPNADQCLTEFDHWAMNTDVRPLWNTHASVNLPSAYETPICFNEGNQKSNAGAITNPISGLDPKTTMYAMKSNGVNQKLDALAISNPTRDKVRSIRRLLMHCTDGKEELDFVDNLPNLHDFLMECSDDKQEAGVMEISNPTRDKVQSIKSLLMRCNDGKEELDLMDNLPNLHDFLMECSDDKQEAGVMAISDPTLGNLLNADEFSANCIETMQEPNAMASANLTPFNVPYANKSSAYSTDGYQELDVMAPSNPTTGYGHNSSHYSVESATKTAVSFPPVCLTNANHSHSEFADQLIQGDVDHHWEWLRNVLHGSSP